MTTFTYDDQNTTTQTFDNPEYIQSVAVPMGMLCSITQVRIQDTSNISYENTNETTFTYDNQ